MRSAFAFARSITTFACLAGFPILASAQTFAARVGAPAPAMVTVDGIKSHVEVPGARHSAKEKLIFARVRDGVYTVDGMVAKVHLNYDVQGSTYLYLYVPGIGTAVLSVSPDGKAVVTPATLHMDELTFTVDGHHYGLSGISVASDRGVAPAHLYVRLDRAAWHLNRTPMVGFGNRAELPYEWPGSLPPELSEESMDAPPVPMSLLPAMKAARPATTATTAFSSAAQSAPASPSLR